MLSTYVFPWISIIFLVHLLYHPVLIYAKFFYSDTDNNATTVHGLFNKGSMVDSPYFTQNFTICAFVAKTNIGQLDSKYSCTESNVPDSDICRGLWFQSGIVKCNDDLLITSFTLFNTSVTGVLTPAFHKLSDTLISLIITNSGISSTIPSQYGRLTNLQILTLANNKLKGSIPSKLGTMSSITSINLSNNKLTAILPSELSSCENLVQLDVSGNSLSYSIPSSLSYLQSLTYLNFENNILTGNIMAITDVFQEQQYDYISQVNTEELQVHKQAIIQRHDQAGSLYQQQQQQQLSSYYYWSSLQYLNLGNNLFTGTLRTSIGYLNTLTSLVLSSNKITGTFPPTLAFLTNLVIFDFQNTGMVGNIPDVIGNLSNIEILNLNNNNFNGTLPLSITALSKIKELHLSGNLFSTTLPTILAALYSLTYLEMNSNRYYGILPSSYGTFQRLQYLDLYNNSLSGPIPSALGTSPALNTIILVKNDLTGILPSFPVTANFTILNLSYNNIRGIIPSSLGNIISLQYLSLDYNSFSGRIPSEIGYLSNLLELTITYNSLSQQLPSSLGSLSSLTSLALSNNKILSTLPTTLGNLAQLVTLKLDYNNIYGTIPTTIVNLYQLEYLYLQNNYLTGTICAYLGLLINLKQIEFQNNKLNGSIPISIGSLYQLEQLHLYNNELTGPLPYVMGKLISLLSLQINSCSLTGSIPSSIGSLHSLTSLIFYDNKLTGTLPPELNKATSLNVIILSYNTLTGLLPDLSALSSLRLLYLDSNQLSGSIPTTLYDLTRLNALSINYNNLTGGISEDLSKLELLQTLDFHQNKLSGSIPSSIFYSIFFLSINLASNKLTGTIPDVISLQILLKDISFASNQLSGTITSLFGNMLSLNSLSLESNRLTGTIPSNMVSDALTHLSLSDNLLKGSVPSLICDQSLNQLLVDKNINLGCYASCLQDITSLEHGIITTCTHARIMCDLLASINATGKLTGWHCVANIPVTSVCSGDWEGVSCSSNIEVTSISISDSCLVGSLPSSLGQLLSLTAFDISSNSIMGILPSTLSNLSNLVVLELHTNQFTGMLPSGLGKLGTLKTLHLQNNDLQGTIPSTIAGTSLTALLLSNNKILGSVPSELCSLSLKKISFSNNPSLGCYSPCLSSSIISIDYGTVTSCTQASVLCDIINTTNIHTKLSNWNCSHGIPSSDVCGGNWDHVTCFNQSITHLALNGLSLLGYLPTTIEKLSQLLFFNASDNHIKGSIPSSLNLLTKLKYLDLSHNSFSHTIPTGLNTLAKVTYLSFSNNKLTKTIPNNIWTLSLLNQFDLHSNFLTGSIPSILVVYSSLTFLDVSDNLLTGTLPSALCAMKYLIVNGNSKLGCYPSCASKIGTFVHGSVTECTSPSSSESPVLSTTYITIVVVLGSVFLCLIISLIIYRGELKKRKKRVVMISDSKLASNSILSVVLHRTEDRNSIHSNNNHIFFPGTLQLKSIDEGKPVNVAVSAGTFMFEREYELQFELYQKNPKVFAQPFGFARYELIDFSAIDTAILINTSRNPAGIVLEPCTGDLRHYLDDHEVEAEIRYYRKGKVATSLINIAATAAAKKVMFPELNIAHLRVYENDCVKLAVIGKTTAFDEKLVNEIRQKSTRKTAPLSQKCAVDAGSESHSDLATVALVTWKLGLLLLELFSSSSPISSTLNDTSFDMINFMDQEGIKLMIGRRCPGPKNYLRRQLLYSLLQINPDQRPVLTHSDFQVDQFLENDKEEVIFFFIRKSVPLSVVMELLTENPQYVSLENNDGQLPLQYALTVNADPLLLTHLLVMYPDSCLSRFPKNNFSLTDYALQYSMSDAHMRVLLPYFMPIDSEGKERDSEAHDYGWVKVLQHLDPPDKYIDTVYQMLTMYSDHIRQLAYCVDELGRTAINIATPKCKEEIIKILYFLGIYDLSSEIAHQSNTCIVRLGMDTQQHNKVALKFMKHKDQFEREISVRAKANFSDEFVLGFLRSMDSDTDENLRIELTKKGYADFKYVLVMTEAERTLLEIIAHEHIAGKDWDKIRGLCTQLTQAVRHVHSAGLIHGDIKPLNIMRVRGRLVLIDLDACVSFKDGQYAGAKYSSAYIPPEMIYLHDKVDGSAVEPIVRSYAVDASLKPITKGFPYTLLPAQPSYDMWSLGVTLFHLCSGTPLFRCDNDDSIDLKAMMELYRWTDNYMTDLLLTVSDPLARNLLSQLLNKNPERRPSADRVLAHPFLSGKVAARLPGELPEFDVFISYRVTSDAHHVEMLYRALSIKEVKVWWDRVCLEDGKPWEEGFCNGLAKSMAFVPILSREAINSDLYPNRQNFTHLTTESPCDNVFLEHRLALEMRAMGLIELIYPVMIGDFTGGMYSHYFSSGCHPKANSIAVKAVEEKVIEHLDRQGLGAPFGATTTVSGVLGELLKNQGGFVVGKEETAFNQIIDKIVDMVAQARNAKKKSTEETPVESYSAYQTEIKELKQKVIELTEKLDNIYNSR